MNRKIFLALMISGCTLMSGAILAQANPDGGRFPWPEGKKAALSLSFDDARLSNVDVGLDFFKKFDARVTYYVVPGGVEQRLAQWKEAVALGHEIGNHTLHHPCSGNFEWARSKALESYSLASMRKELLDASSQIRTLLGVEPVSFAYSCGQTYVGRGVETRSYVPLIAELFESGRGWLNEAANDPYFLDFAQLQGIEMDGKDFAGQIKPILERAMEKGNWVVLAGHEIGEGGSQTTRTRMLEELLIYVRQHQNEIWLAPVGEVAAHVRKQRQEVLAGMKEHLTFYSSFDRSVDADFAKGDRTLYTATSYGKADDAAPGIQTPEVMILPAGGRYGDGLVFNKKITPALYYHSKGNVAYDEKDFSGTISFWLSLDPELDLEPGYCDPIQITDSGYNDAAFWVDFSDKNPRLFRMGVFGDLKIWNPKNISPDENPDFNNRLVVAKDRPFGKGVWTLVTIVYENINDTGKARATFYINGKMQGDRKIPEGFTWDLEKSKIFLGLNYVGQMDDLAIFNKALSAREIEAIYQLEGGISSILD